MSPAENRIAEIGVVAVDGHRVDRWTSWVRTPARRDLDPSMIVATQDGDGENEGREAAPSFRDIAADLALRLSGRLLVAHNARFDHAFLKSEFARVGIPFNPQVLCSVRLSRKLYPHLARHDLDSLVEHHGLHAETRHRALPDADLVWQLWQAIDRQFQKQIVDHAIKSLLAEPLLPPQLEPTLIAQLPESPGAYVLHGEHDHPLVVGAAANLRRHIVDYFRLDQASGKALEYAHRITNITWHATRGALGARLHAAVLDGELCANAKRKMSSVGFSWQFSPDAIPCVAVMPLPRGRVLGMTEWFGVFASERKARNALVRFATRHRICERLLGISEFAKVRCPACRVDQPGCACVTRTDRTRQLMLLFAALTPLRIAVWPYPGPVGIRERSDLHVVDGWQFFGTARSESEIYGLLESRPRVFDQRLYRLLKRTLSRLPQGKIVDLSMYAHVPFVPRTCD